MKKKKQSTMILKFAFINYICNAIETLTSKTNFSVPSDYRVLLTF